MGNRDLRIASPSFFQVNTAQALNLIDLVKSGLDLRPGDVLVDAYAGVGVFAILLAHFVSRAIAIEESASAIQDGKSNAADLKNVEFVQLKTEEALADLVEVCDLNAAPDAVILDPPRVGCHPAALESLVGLAPDRVAYVSCDPPSLARDLDILTRGGYSVSHVQPVDMFPQTYHVESVTTLQRRTTEID
jgi:23S rRNA (uracil1939-C5)-methyltransferase